MLIVPEQYQHASFCSIQENSRHNLIQQLAIQKSLLCAHIIKPYKTGSSHIAPTQMVLKYVNEASIQYYDQLLGMFV